ncbi:M48 family metalloprotease [Brachymonas sp.]|uniref:M48 family metalloprotease n=1 Tax=Brachymonas sp. TaxID=1936292 RepID=UPI0035B040DE
MRFLEHQRSARQATSRLLLAFGLTVLLLLTAVNGGLMLVWWALSHLLHSRQTYLPPFFFQVNTGLVLLFVFGGWWIESSNLSRGGAAIARRCGARELLLDDQHPAEVRLRNTVHEMTVAAGMPMPAVMVLPRQWAINAFAAGLEPRQAAIAVTDGALDALTREELQGLVAHELSHIAEGDTRLNTRLAGMVFGLEMVFRFGQALAQIRADERGSAMRALFGLPVMIVGSAGWVAGRLLCAAVSRQREFLADARAVQWTRNPAGLGGVLLKISSQQFRQQDGASPFVEDDADDDTLWDVDAYMRQQPMITHMLLAEPLTQGWQHRLEHWFSSHPPLDERIRRIYGYMPA